MTRITTTCIIDAPPDVVFRTEADIAKFSKALPQIVKFEFLSDNHTGGKA